MADAPTRAVRLPLFGLAAFTLMFSIYESLHTYYGADTPARAEVLWAIGFSFFTAWWVYVDRRQRQYAASFSFDALVLFLWPIVLPYYTYQTRGFKGLFLGLGFWVLYNVPYLAAMGLYLVLTQ